MSWLDFQEILLKGWVGIFTVFLWPLGRWINSKRKNYELLKQRVEELERQGERSIEEIENVKRDVKNLEEKIDTNQSILCEKLDGIGKDLNKVIVDTAVNKAKIEK